MLKEGDAVRERWGCRGGVTLEGFTLTGWPIRLKPRGSGNWSPAFANLGIDKLVFGVLLGLGPIGPTVRGFTVGG